MRSGGGGGRSTFGDDGEGVSGRGQPLAAASKVTRNSHCTTFIRCPSLVNLGTVAHRQPTNFSRPSSFRPSAPRPSAVPIGWVVTAQSQQRPSVLLTGSGTTQMLQQLIRLFDLGMHLAAVGVQQQQFVEYPPCLRFFAFLR